MRAVHDGGRGVTSSTSTPSQARDPPDLCTGLHTDWFCGRSFGGAESEASRSRLDCESPNSPFQARSLRRRGAALRINGPDCGRMLPCAGFLGQCGVSGAARYELGVTLVAQPIPDEFRSILDAAAQRHTRLVLVVGGDVSDRSMWLRGLSRILDVHLVNLGLSVGERLLAVSTRHRPIAAADAAADLIRAAGVEHLCLVDHLELLFLPELQLDPLKLLADSARQRTVVSAWPGESCGTTLRYAHPLHPEHRSYECPDCIVTRCPNTSQGNC